MKEKVRYINLGDDTYIKIDLYHSREATELELSDDYWQGRFDDWGEDWEDE